MLKEFLVGETIVSLGSTVQQCAIILLGRDAAVFFLRNMYTLCAEANLV